MKHSVLEHALQAIEASDSASYNSSTLRRQLASQLAQATPGPGQPRKASTSASRPSCHGWHLAIQGPWITSAWPPFSRPSSGSQSRSAAAVAARNGAAKKG